MSDINLDFTVSNNNIGFTVEPNEITITPTDIQLSVIASVNGLPGGNSGQLQYNNAGAFGGVVGTSFNGSNLTLGNVSNVKITGGTNGYFLQTDGTGNLNWSAAGSGGNGSPGGSNTQIQYNDSGVFGGSSSFTFDKVTGNVNITGNLSVASNIAGTLSTGAQPNITSLGTLTSVNVSGTTSVYEAIENVQLISPQTGTYNFNALDGSIQYATANATGNLVLNFVGNGSTTLNSFLANGKSTTLTYVMTTGSSAYGVTGVQIDGTSQTIKLAGLLTPIANVTTTYTFTLIKTSTTPTYTVLASATRYV